MNDPNIFNTELTPVTMTPVLKKYFMAITRWAIFSGVVGAIGVLISIFFFVTVCIRTMDSFFYRSYGWWPIITTLTFTVIAFWVVFFHLKFAVNMRRALKWNNQDAFEQGWSSFLNHFRFFGIYAILTLMFVGSMITDFM